MPRKLMTPRLSHSCLVRLQLMRGRVQQRVPRRETSAVWTRLRDTLCLYRVIWVLSVVHHFGVEPGKGTVIVRGVSPGATPLVVRGNGEGNFAAGVNGAVGEQFGCWRFQCLYVIRSGQWTCSHEERPCRQTGEE